MRKKSTGGTGNMLLLAGLGVGAFMLFGNKSNAQNSAPSVDLPTGTGEDIPDAPKILAVNSSGTESPLPTGIVSDEEGMEVTSTPSSSNSSRGSSSQGASSYDSAKDSSSSAEVLVASSNASAALVAEVKEYNEIPPLVSTKLTPKEKNIIDHGKLSTALAVKRPDLYKAAYIKRFGGKTQAGKKAALAKANAAINAAAAAAKAAKSGGLIKAVKYPAKPEYTFAQSAGGMSSQVAMTRMAALQKAGIKAHHPTGKPVVHKASKGKHPLKKVAAHPVHPTHPAKKRPVKPIHHTSTKRVIKKH